MIKLFDINQIDEYYIIVTYIKSDNTINNFKIIKYGDKYYSLTDYSSNYIDKNLKVFIGVYKYFENENMELLDLNNNKVTDFKENSTYTLAEFEVENEK